MSPLVIIAEALVDHEVTFAVVPEQAELTEAILRQTGSHVASLDVAQYVFCDAASLEAALQGAADGTWEYPDAGATVICLVPSISPGTSTPPPGPLPAGGEGESNSNAITLVGPGIRDTASVAVEGFSPEARRAFGERNAMRPLGLDIIFVSSEGSLVSLTRYTRLQEE